MSNRPRLFVVSDHAQVSHPRHPDYFWYFLGACCYTALCVGELWGALSSGSLALLGDALHVGVDALVLTFSGFVDFHAVRAGTIERRARLRLYGTMVNGVLLVLTALGIAKEALPSLLEGVHAMDPGQVFYVTAFTLPAHLIVYFLVLARVEDHEHGGDLKASARWHTLIDIVLACVAVISAGLVKWTALTGWDPLLSLIVAAVLFVRGAQFVSKAKLKLAGFSMDLSESERPRDDAS